MLAQWKILGQNLHIWKLLAGWPRPLRPINLPLRNDIEKLNFARNSKMIENFPDLECWPILGQGHFSCKRSSCPSTKTSSDPEKSFLECFWPLGQDKKSGPLQPLRILLKKDVISRFLTFLMIFFATKAAKSWPETFFDWFGTRCGPSGWYWVRIFIFESFWPGWPRPLRPMSPPLWNDIEK